MKSFRFRKEARASTDVVTKKPNLLRRFAHKAKKIFHSTPPSSSAPTSTATTLPAQLQEAAAQSPTSLREDTVLEPAEWLSSGILPNQVVASRQIKTTSQRSRLPKHVQRTLDSASSVYSQPADRYVGLCHTQPHIPKPSEPNRTTTTRLAKAESSDDISAAVHRQTETEEDGDHKAHARCQQSVDVGNKSFFRAPDTRTLQQQVSMSSAALLTDDAEDYSDSFAVIFVIADKSRPDDAEAEPTYLADINSKPIAEGFFSAQSSREVEVVRRQRAVFAARLEVELDMQKASLEADFEKCYDTSDRLHEIDLLNLREDHEAEVSSLQEERDAGVSEVETLTAQREGLRNDVLLSNAQVSGLERLLAERTREAETHQHQASSLVEDNKELVSEIDRLRRVVQECSARLREAGHFHEVLHLQNGDLVRLNGEACAAYETERKEKESALRQLVALVDEKSKDFTWHIQGERCSLELKCEDEEKAESQATAMAGELCRRETEKVTKLSNELAELRISTEAKLRGEARNNTNLAEVAHANAVALDGCLHEKKDVERKYQELLQAVSVDVSLPELAKGLAHDLQVAFEERSLFSLAFMEAELQLIKSEQRRKDQVCDLRDLVQERDDQLACAQKKLDEAELKISGQEFILEARDDEIKNTVPELKERIAELEKTMELHAMDTSQFQRNVITDLNRRIERQKQLAGFYEHNFMQAINQYDNLKIEWDFYVGSTVDDLQLARGFRDQRDSLNIECRALRERFADELLVQPLVVPEGMKTKSEIEEEQLRNMDEGVLKQFLMTYKALPKWLVEPGCPGYEQLRIDVMIPELDRVKREADAVHRSFSEEGQDGDGDESGKIPGQEDEEEDCTF